MSGIGITKDEKTVLSTGMTKKTKKTAQKRTVFRSFLINKKLILHQQLDHH